MARISLLMIAIFFSHKTLGLDPCIAFSKFGWSTSADHLERFAEEHMHSNFNQPLAYQHRLILKTCLDKLKNSNSESNPLDSFAELSTVLIFEGMDPFELYQDLKIISEYLSSIQYEKTLNNYQRELRHFFRRIPKAALRGNFSKLQKIYPKVFEPFSKRILNQLPALFLADFIGLQHSYREQEQFLYRKIFARDFHKVFLKTYRDFYFSWIEKENFPLFHRLATSPTSQLNLPTTFFPSHPRENLQRYLNSSHKIQDSMAFHQDARYLSVLGSSKDFHRVLFNMVPHLSEKYYEKFHPILIQTLPEGADENWRFFYFFEKVHGFVTEDGRPLFSGFVNYLEFLKKNEPQYLTMEMLPFLKDHLIKFLSFEKDSWWYSKADLAPLGYFLRDHGPELNKKFRKLVLDSASGTEKASYLKEFGRTKKNIYLASQKNKRRRCWFFFR